jgi:hypothetical protein
MADARWVKESPASEKLGLELRAIREKASVKAKEVPRPDGGFYRSSTISRIETNKAAASEDMLKVYVGMGGDEQVLRHLYDSAQVEKELILRPPRRSLDWKTANFYKVLSRVEMHSINERGATTGVAVDLTISPARNSLTVSHSYPSDPVRSNIQLAARNGSEVLSTERSHSGLVTGTLSPSSHEMESVTRQSFSYIARVVSPVPAVPYVVYYAQHLTERYDLHVNFRPEQHPSKVWWFRGFDVHEAERRYVHERLLRRREPNSYLRSFRDLDGEFCGIAWNW